MQEILALNRYRPQEGADIDDALRQSLQRRDASFGAASVLFYDRPIQMVSASGVWMRSADGQSFLDMYNNVPSIGHCHPKVVEAMRLQAATLNIHTRYLSEISIAYAERLLAMLPKSLAHLTMTCTGTESNDLALRMASTWTGKRGFIVSQAAYHGNSAAVSQISPTSMPQASLPPHVRSIRLPDPRDCPPEQMGGRMAEALEKAIAELEAAGFGFAAFIADSIFSSDGVYADPVGFLAPVVEAAQKAGGLFIADEVQCGFARTGDQFWGFARHGVTPDIVTMGKPMGNGYPMGGVAVRADILEAFCQTTGYFNTFGGNPVAAAVGLAVLDVIEEEGLMDNARAVGGYLLGEIRQLATRHEMIGAARGAGLFIGVDILAAREDLAPAPKMTKRIINSLRDRGVLLGAAGPHASTLKIRPPLCLTRDDADIFLRAFDEVLVAERTGV